MPLRIKSKDEKGMTLVEVLLALAILVLLAASFVPMLSTSEILTLKAGRETLACSYATAIVETIKAYHTELDDIDFAPYPDPDGDSNLYRVVGNDSENFTFKLGEENNAHVLSIPRKIDVDTTTLEVKKYYDEDGNLHEELFEINIIVNWTEGTQSKIYELSTVIGAN